MKLKVIFGIIFSLFLIKTFPVNAKTEVKDSVLYNNVGDVEKTYPLNNGHILIYNNNVSIKSRSYILEIEGEYLDHIENNSKLFLLIYENNINKMYLIENFAITSSILLNDRIIITNLSIQNDHLVLMGKNDNFGYLSFYNYKLELLNEYFYGENNGLKVLDIFLINNKWYMFCEKDAHSQNGYFENVGSYDERKLCMMILNSQLSIEKIKYLNCNDGSETLKFITYKDNLFWMVIAGDTKYHYLKGDNALNTIDKLFEEEKRDLNIILNHNNEFLRFINSNNLTMNVNDETLTLSKEPTLGIYLEDGLLKSVYFKNNNLYLNEISEYHIDYINPFEITYFKGSLEKNVDLNHTKNIEINSYFEKVEVFLNTDINLRISGKYDVALLIKRSSGDDIAINNELLIKDYANVFEGAVYSTGKVLKFMGYGYLNDVEINNGHQINQPGKYKLELKNNKGDIVFYNFEVVDEYYNRTELIDEYDYYVAPNESIDITIDIDNTEEVKEVWINDEKVKFKQIDDKIIYSAYGLDQFGLKTYCLNKIVYENKEIQYSKEIKVLTTKKVPKIEIFEQSSEFPIIDLRISDVDQAILKLEIIYKIGNEEKVIDYYFNEFICELPELIDKVTSLRINLVYTNGIKEVFNKNIIDFIGTFKKEQLFKIETNKSQNGIDNIKISFNKINNIEKLNVVNESIKDNYNYVFSYTSLIVSGSITLVVVGVIVFIIIKKRNKNKKLKEKEAIVE